MRNILKVFTLMSILICTFGITTDLQSELTRGKPIGCPLSTGATIFIWQVTDSTGSIYLESNIYNNGTWGTPTVISSPTQKAMSPVIVADNFGNAVVVYMAVDNMDSIQYGYLAGYTTGYGWFSPRKITTNDAILYQSTRASNQLVVVNKVSSSTFIGVWSGFDIATNEVCVYSTTATFSTITGWSSLTPVVKISP